MEHLYIAPGVSTPEVGFDSKEDILFFKGKSYPTNPEEFYQPVFNWLDDYFNARNIDQELHILFDLEYYNTSSSKQFARLFKLLGDKQMHDKVVVKWCYHEKDLDMLEAGQRFSQYTGLKFEIEATNSNLIV